MLRKFVEQLRSLNHIAMVSSFSALYEKEFKSIEGQYPELIPTLKNEQYILQGTIYVIDDNGDRIDMYKILVKFPKNYPQSLPIVYEMGGKIERVAEMHINDDGSCCLGTMASMAVVLKGKVTLLNFINELVIPYFTNQTYKILTGDYADGEFSHGALGVYEFYSDILGFDDLRAIILCLSLIIDGNLPNRNESCFCQSKKKYKKCHLKNIKLLFFVSRDILINDRKKFIDLWQLISG